MTASFYWGWDGRVIKQVSAGTKEMYCFYDSYFKNDAMGPKMQSTACCVLGTVSLGAVTSAVPVKLWRRWHHDQFPAPSWGCNEHLDFPTAITSMCSMPWVS
jgi:hypothetical protein